MTSSELLIDTLTKFGDSEPTTIFVCWIDTESNIQVSGNASATQVMGMAEYVKLATFKAMVAK